jgi:hypothetical protein
MLVVMFGCVKSGAATFHTPKISFNKLENPEIFDFGKAMDWFDPGIDASANLL